MKACGDIRELMTLYIENDLNKDSNLDFEEHLYNCNSCRLEFEEFKTVIKLCEEINDEEIPDGFSQSLHDKLVIEKQKQDNDKKLIYKNKYFKVITSIAAVLLLVVFVKGIYFTKIQSYMFSFMNTKNEKSKGSGSNKDGELKGSLKKSPDDSAKNTIQSSKTPETTFDNKTAESTVPPSSKTPLVGESPNKQSTINVPKSVSEISIQSDMPGKEEEFVRSILKQDNVNIDDESNKGNDGKKYYLVMKFKYENRKYKDFINTIKKNISSNLSISEENVDSDIALIKSLEEQKRYYDGLLIIDNFDKNYVENEIKNLDNQINEIKDTKYYTDVIVTIILIN
jgi:hypothetical protein